jgi:NADH-quinone oxidoreductase subunit G
LRVLGNLLGLTGFDFDSIEQVRAACVPQDLAARLDNRTALDAKESPKPLSTNGFERIADVPIYFADALVRRASSLQQTADAKSPKAWLNAASLAKLGLSAGAQVKVVNGAGAALLSVGQDDGLPDGCVRVAGGHPSTINAGPLSGVVQLERVG